MRGLKAAATPGRLGRRAAAGAAVRHMKRDKVMSAGRRSGRGNLHCAVVAQWPWVPRFSSQGCPLAVCSKLDKIAGTHAKPARAPRHSQKRDNRKTAHQQVHPRLESKPKERATTERAATDRVQTGRGAHLLRQAPQPSVKHCSSGSTLSDWSEDASGRGCAAASAAV